MQNVKRSGGQMHDIRANANLAVTGMDAHLLVLNNARFEILDAARAAQSRFHAR